MLLLIRGGYVWTGKELLSDVGILCQDGRIKSLGPWSELQKSHPQVQVLGGPKVAVLPGLINAHHHGNGITSFARGVPDQCLEPWLSALGAAPPVDPYLDTLWAALDIVRGGYTTVALFQSTANPQQAEVEARARINACRDVGLRVAFGLDVMQQNFYVYGPDPVGLPPRVGLTPAAYIELLEKLHSEYASDPTVEIFAAPSGPEWVTDETWEAIGAWTRNHRVPLHTHCLESPYQAKYAQQQWGSIVTHLDRLGALHEQTSLVHGVYLKEDELELVAERHTSLITNPASNLRLRCGISPVLTALEKGVNVALGSDGCSLGDRDDALAEMRLLLYLQRTPGIATPALTWQQAIEASTIAAARTTPWGSGIGIIEPGAVADLSLFDWHKVVSPWIHPDLHPVHVLVHRASALRHLVANVVGGQVIWEAEHGFTNVDVDGVAARLRDHLQGLTSKSGSARSARKDATSATKNALSPTKPEKHETSSHDVIDRVRSYYHDWNISHIVSKP